MVKLLTKTEFAKLAEVTPASITKALKGELGAALSGKKINANHPAAQAYLSRLDPPPEAPATGLDPLYEAAVAFYQSTGRGTILEIRDNFSIGKDRAMQIVRTMKAAGVITKKGKEPAEKVEKPAPEKKVPARRRGLGAQQENKKQATHERLKAQETEGTPKKHATTDEYLIEIPEYIQEFLGWTLQELIDKFGTDYRLDDWLKATQKIEVINEKRLKNAQTEGRLVARDMIRKGIVEPIDASHISLLTNGAKTMSVRAVAMAKSGRNEKEVEAYMKKTMTTHLKRGRSKADKTLKDVEN